MVSFTTRSSRLHRKKPHANFQFSSFMILVEKFVVLNLLAGESKAPYHRTLNKPRLLDTWQVPFYLILARKAAKTTTAAQTRMNGEGPKSIETVSYPFWGPNCPFSLENKTLVSVTATFLQLQDMRWTGN